jgi:hypothetical protein
MLLEWDGYDKWDFLFNEDNVDVENKASTHAANNRSGFTQSTERPYLQPDDDIINEPFVYDSFDNRRDVLIKHYFGSQAFGLLN